MSGSYGAAGSVRAAPASLSYYRAEAFAENLALLIMMIAGVILIIRGAANRRG